MLSVLSKIKLDAGLSGSSPSRMQIVLRAFYGALCFSLYMTLAQSSIWSLAYFAQILPAHPTDILVFVFIWTPLLTLSGAFLIQYRTGLRIHRLAMANKALDEMSRVDPLSTLLNRRAFLDAFARRTEDAILIVFDIDFFKQVNDRHGHAVGDEVIETVAGIIRREFDHATDVVCRLGGEEFGVLSQGKRIEDDYRRADRARAETIRHVFTTGDQTFFVTLSGGMAHAGAGVAFETAFKQADKAMYAAKQRGRNLILRPQFDDLGAS
jgi:diguanylate cyclase (GGDEF)-like protein